MKHCRRCKALIRKYHSYMDFLLPLPDGQVRKVTMHGDCIEQWNKLATSPEYSGVFLKKQRAHLRAQGIYMGATA